MTGPHTPDTSPEAVERPIRFHPVLSVDSRVGMRMDINGGYIRYEDYKALSAALEEEKRARMRLLNARLMSEDYARAEAAEAERDALKAELSEAVELLISAETVMQFVLDHEASELDRRLTIKDAMSSQKETRAFLSRHQKETDT